jgi:hypothetical protein
MAARLYGTYETVTPNIAAPRKFEKYQIRTNQKNQSEYCCAREAKKGCDGASCHDSYRMGRAHGAQNVGVHGMHTETLSSKAKQYVSGRRNVTYCKPEADRRVQIGNDRRFCWHTVLYRRRPRVVRLTGLRERRNVVKKLI